MRIIRSQLCLASLTIIVLVNACKTQKHFVQVKDKNFIIEKKIYHFVGTNFWYGAYIAANADYGNRPRLIRELNHLQKLGVKNLRVVAASEESDYGLPLSPPFQYKNGKYNETLLQGLDFLLAEMHKRDMRAILILNNYWDWSGGMGQYVSWTTGQSVIDPSTKKTDTWDDAMKFSATFYTNVKAQEIYRKYIKMITNRVNIYTKKAYRDETAIMAWELANEPRPSGAGNMVEKMKIFAKWIDETAKYIHNQAPNQLVTTGSEGSKGTLNSLDNTLQAHNSEYIDYMTFHMWPKNWGWYQADKPEMLASAKANTAKYIDEHIELANKLNKPTVLEEFGFVRDRERFSADSSTNERDSYYRFVLDFMKNRIRDKKPIGGLNFWGWGGEGRGKQKDYMWKAGDNSFTGDPFGEAQGLNSIFNTDKSTLSIISRYAQEIDKK
ncbi:hypothetical protein [Pedobacter sp. Leaf194]|uniref:glycoside hydrolase 5 family protein n=1 Tax=Pedobacter sp. Leaf194 TaxID=1736297 RepID=UPI00070389C9|nr:hypothetical protein [Pedobacter sp. Leaf194]KQS36795.1 hypothetical protein ASG14_07095 [Pedobacter sp. Leaf194]